MINSFLIAALGAVVVISGLGARRLYRLHRRCCGVEHSSQASGGLLRWYAEGFERLLSGARWTVRVEWLLIVLAVLAQAHPAIIALGVITLLLGQLELHCGAASMRQHQREAARRFARDLHDPSAPAAWP